MGPYHEPFKEGRLQNRDKDKLATKDFVTLKRDLDFSQGTEELFEYLDLWDNPFVYIHNRDYDKKLEYLDGEGSRVTVKAAKSAKLGAYQSPTSFQIWSFGPNKINENGEGDDIASWK